ncbi:2-keto-4-pentenoate hydratase [Polaromonas sp. CG_9.5]|uniref:fumarylacetoacetate hydrolase family protein n=1 Tax=Polaromonas sp. CG_9.5 TaxID=3071705 RepID=UPI002E0B557C|nr:2-keto-4-pentenoate hydratase [Polaromonas sp. CG_9.5]
MPLSSVQPAIDALVQAWCDHRTTDAAPFAPAIASAAQAYAVQQGVAERLAWFTPGAPPYWKTGGPSRQAVQTHARLPERGIWHSPASTDWPFAMRGIEAEIALRLAVPVDAALAAGLDRDSASQLVDAMTVAIEVVDSRWTQGGQAPDLLKLADLQSHGALVLGDWLPFDAEHDWATQRCRVEISGAPAQTFAGTHSLGDPAWVLAAWLRHATQGGQVLPAGSVVTTGTWCGVLQAKAGDTVVATFDGIGSARIAFSA